MVDPNMEAFINHPPVEKPDYFAVFIDGKKVDGDYDVEALMERVDKIREGKIPLLARIRAKEEKVLML